VAGTSEGITTMQMDIKVAGITREIFEAALNQAKEGRAHILGEMNKALGEVRTELSAHAPRIETLRRDDRRTSAPAPSSGCPSASTDTENKQASSASACDAHTPCH